MRPNFSSKHALTLFQKHQGVLRTRQALALGIHPMTLYALRDQGKIEALTRGVYQLSDSLFSQPDLLTVGAALPQGVICLISALHYHGLTTQIPSQIYVALREHSSRPKHLSPSVRLFWWKTKVFEAGIETFSLQGVPVKIYDPEKTVVDCFRMRNKIGLDVALEALKIWMLKRKKYLPKLETYVRLSHMSKVMLPYLEVLL